jgi:lipopolysaccharide biosynthesis glycosyltransferase
MESQQDICCFTSSNYAYLSRARVLASTFKKYNPNSDMVLLLVDKEPENFSLNLENEPFDRVVYVHEIGIPDFNNWSFKHNVVELCTAIKASAAKFLLNQYEKVIYLDPDIAVFDSLSDIIEKLNIYDIILTPHQLSPCIDRELEIKDIELCSLKHGIFNLGFFAVNNKLQALDFLNWWESRLLKYCYEDIPSGIFTDQKWCNLAPMYYSKLYINRDFGCNTASWNLHERSFEYIDNKIYINKTDSLKFYHFTKYGGAGDAMTKRYATNQLVFEIWYWYGQWLRNFNENQPPKGHYYYGYYSNGDEIKQEDRLLFRANYKIGLSNPYEKI